MYSATREAFSDDHRRVVEAVSGQVAQTVRQSLDFEKARTTRFKDALTGLPHFDQAKALLGPPGNVELTYPFALLFLDIDGLKTINLRYGRKAGDEIVEAVATSARRTLRAADLLLRSGSDEFIILLFKTDQATCARLAAHVRTVVSNAVHAARPVDHKCSVSVSCAAAPDDGSSLDELLTVARHRNASSERVKLDPSPDSGDAVH
jgi:diguanylate cyclase (GGDEF)-like protein